MKDKENTKEKTEVTDLKTEDKDKEEEKQLAPEGCSQEQKKMITEDEAEVPRTQRRPKTLQIKVTLLDNTFYECELDVRAFKILIFFLICTQNNRYITHTSILIPFHFSPYSHISRIRSYPFETE